MSADNTDDLELPEEIIEAANEVAFNSLPEQSRQIYRRNYIKFLQWKERKNLKSWCEKVFLAYFGELSKKYKSSTMWSHFSMIKSMVRLKEGIQLDNYRTLAAFLKKNHRNYEPKKSEVFEPNHIKKFLDEAPDHTYLAVKIGCIMGLHGACRRSELYNMKTNDITYGEHDIIVTIPKTKNRVPRTFVIKEDKYIQLIRKYSECRPVDYVDDHFFISYSQSKCKKQRIGINMIGKMPKAIAEYLKIPLPNKFTGHCYRRSSSTLFVDEGANITALKRHGGWKSTSVAEGYIQDSLSRKRKAASMITNRIENHEGSSNSATSTSPDDDIADGAPWMKKMRDLKNTVTVNFNGCGVQ